MARGNAIGMTTAQTLHDIITLNLQQLVEFYISKTRLYDMS